MAEYIDREAAIDAVKKERNYTGKFTFEEEHAWAVGFQQGITFALSDIATIPAADVRPVVLCLHCKNWDTSWAPNCGKEYGHFCPMVGNVTGADWFCACGEKREES